MKARPWIRRNLEGRLWVWMPWAGGSHKAWLKTTLGTRTRPEWNKFEHRWEVARKHLSVLIPALVERFDEVELVLEFSVQERCDTRCQQATGDDCTCSCLGFHHNGAYWRDWVQIGETTLIADETHERRILVSRKDLLQTYKEKA